MNDRLIYWVWLTLVFGPANPRVWQLSSHYDDVETFVNALQDNSVRDVTDKEKSRIRKTQISDAKRLLEICEKKNINVYCYESEGYPQKLKRIANPPTVLFCCGSLDFLNDKICIAVVGTRKPSDYSVEVTQKICETLANRGIVLVSGFAQGIDQIANKAALKNNCPTAAMYGVAVDEDYPQDSAELKKQVADHGVVISEYYPGYRALGSSFSKRNRIMVGISDAVLFCECSASSHGLDNAKYASIQGKPIFVIPPHDIFDPRYFGQRDLIRNDCRAVFSGADIVYNLMYERLEDIKISGGLGEFTLPADDSAVFNPQSEKKPVNKRKNKINKSNNAKAKEIQIKHNADYSFMSPLQEKICKLLENENLLADEIAVRTGENISTILSELTELEIYGAVRALEGKLYGIV